jgi:hypothetical protein
MADISGIRGDGQDLRIMEQLGTVHAGSGRTTGGVIAKAGGGLTNGMKITAMATTMGATDNSLRPFSRAAILERPGRLPGLFPFQLPQIHRKTVEYPAEVTLA